MGKRPIDIDIEDLLGWTYRVQRADIVIDRGYGLHPIERQADGIPVFRASTDGVAACMRSGATGTSGRAGAASIKADLHPDAERVHKTVMMMGGDDASLIIRHAKAADRPAWLPGARHRFEPMWKGARKIDAETGLPIKGSYDVIREVDRNRHTVRVFCPIIEYDGPEYVGAKREISGRWHRALVTLADHFIEAPLDDHVIVQWRVPAKPWLARDTELSSEKISA